MTRTDCRTDGEGRIKMATISAPDLGACEEAYARHLGYELIERGTVDEALASSWGTPRQAGRRYLVMGPASGAQVFVRFIKSEPVPEYVPLRSFGWAALEITVQDADRLNSISTRRASAGGRATATRSPTRSSTTPSVSPPIARTSCR